MSTSVVVVIILVVTGLSVAQPSTKTTNTNTPLIYYCGSYYPMSTAVFFRNLNLTFSQLRSQLSNAGIYNAQAQNMVNGDAVYGVAQCRNYLVSAECLACFDVAVSALEPCGSANGAHVFLDNCYLRFENYNEFYNNPQSNQDVDVTEICGNESTSQPVTAFNQAVQELLSDIIVATPRTSDFYIASTRQLTSGANATIYAIAQCFKNAGQAICKNCLSTAYEKLYSCVPASEARAINVACFMRYSEFPFFQNNQTINLIPFLGTGSSSKSGIVIGVSSSAGLVLLFLALFFWYRRWKKSKTVGKGAQCYRYQDLKLATNNFSEEYLIGKGGYGQVFKAIIDGGIVVAVKKINVGLKAKKEFENEVNLISDVRHRNLILQLGWCIDGPELLLVLEYIPHGSLDKGYTSPEYAMRGHLSEKVDTYSFGIVVLEVISGVSCSDVKYSGPRMEYLLDHAWQLYEKGIHIKLVDEAIDPNEYVEENVMNIIEIALMCTQSAALRPTMSEIYLMLSGEPRQRQRQMSKPTFINADRRIYKVGS
ncbi:hypothetical protein M8C21_033811 [Ambrosia artemisiifolia]|uniref:Uncharacterized protein n=1 Tax=Ambrosia artemisiifolia TaxID=4212 RepID=A0AAD5CP22_AMBAR|nr:hypothetical protein M8C21_033811 [Ambrosia artemisiifolia]